MIVAGAITLKSKLNTDIKLDDTNRTTDLEVGVLYHVYNNSEKEVATYQMTEKLKN